MKHINIFILALFVVSTLWCGDSECMTGDSNEACAALVCTLLGNHNGKTSDVSRNIQSECLCVCHTPTLTPIPIDGRFFSPVQTIVVVSLLKIPSAPNRLLFRPPIAS